MFHPCKSVLYSIFNADAIENILKVTKRIAVHNASFAPSHFVPPIHLEVANPVLTPTFTNAKLQCLLFFIIHLLDLLNIDPSRDFSNSSGTNVRLFNSFERFRTGCVNLTGA
jgi:hypothetical protein